MIYYDYFLSSPELKVCIYFPLKRLVSNSGEGGGGGGGGGRDFAVQIHCSEVFLSEGRGGGGTENEFKYSTVLPIVH